MRQQILDTGRLALEAAGYAVRSIAGKQDPLVPPPWLHSVGRGDYREIGDEFFRYFVDLGGLKPNDRVLDIGCGTGRMAAPLTEYLTNGTYDGFDIVEKSIEWCRQAYARFGNFRFRFADLRNDRYNAGSVSAARYRFPYPDRAFDFVFLTSVFTHMQAAEVAHYLSEIRRVLAPGGRVLMTAFLINPKVEALIAAGKAYPSFHHHLPGCRVESAAMPESAVAYDETAFRAMVEDAGLAISQVYYGNWSGADGLSYQDILTARTHR